VIHRRLAAVAITDAELAVTVGLLDGRRSVGRAERPALVIEAQAEHALRARIRAVVGRRALVARAAAAARGRRGGRRHASSPGRAVAGRLAAASEQGS